MTRLQCALAALCAAVVAASPAPQQAEGYDYSPPPNAYLPPPPPTQPPSQYLPPPTEPPAEYLPPSGGASGGTSGGNNGQNGMNGLNGNNGMNVFNGNNGNNVGVDGGLGSGGGGGGGGGDGGVQQALSGVALLGGPDAASALSPPSAGDAAGGAAGGATGGAAAGAELVGNGLGDADATAAEGGGTGASGAAQAESGQYDDGKYDPSKYTNSGEDGRYKPWDGHFTPIDDFDFSYAVKDQQSGNDYAVHESNTGGAYRTLLPDGRYQIVQYAIDSNGIYRQRITYQRADEVKQ